MRVVLAAALGAGLALAGCSSRTPAPVDSWDWKGPVPQGYYLVRKGDTLSEIAERRRTPTRNLIRWNRLKPPYAIYAGKLLRVAPPDGAHAVSRTGAGRSASARSTSPASGSKTVKTSGTRGVSAPKPAPAASQTPGSRAQASGVIWAWPLDGGLRQRYGPGDRTRQGLRIACRPGESVRAAASGTVVYSGSGLKGYGNLIIVKHNETYLSAYGFNRRLLLAEGSGVTRGQAVAECGQGPDGVYLLHFEVRRDGATVDPILYLPPRI